MEFTESDKEVLTQAIDTWLEESPPLDTEILQKVVEVLGKIHRGCTGVKHAMYYLFQLNPIQIGLFQEPPTKYRGLRSNSVEKELCVEVIINNRHAFITKERRKKARRALKVLAITRGDSEDETAW